MDAVTRRAELIDHAVQFGWVVLPGVGEFTAYRVNIARAAARHVIRVTLSGVGAVTSATVDGVQIPGPNRLPKIIVLLRSGNALYLRARDSDKNGIVHWVPRQRRGRTGAALCGAVAPDRSWRRTNDSVDCPFCRNRWAAAVAQLRDWATRAASVRVLPGTIRTYGGAMTRVAGND